MLSLIDAFWIICSLSHLLSEGSLVIITLFSNQNEMHYIYSLAYSLHCRMQKLYLSIQKFVGYGEGKFYPWHC